MVKNSITDYNNYLIQFERFYLIKKGMHMKSSLTAKKPDNQQYQITTKGTSNNDLTSVKSPGSIEEMIGTQKISAKINTNIYKKVVVPPLGMARIPQVTADNDLEMKTKINLINELSNDDSTEQVLNQTSVNIQHKQKSENSLMHEIFNDNNDAKMYLGNHSTEKQGSSITKSNIHVKAGVRVTRNRSNLKNKRNSTHNISTYSTATQARRKKVEARPNQAYFQHMLSPVQAS